MQKLTLRHLFTDVFRKEIFLILQNKSKVSSIIYITNLPCIYTPESRTLGNTKQIFKKHTRMKIIKNKFYV